MSRKTTTTRRGAAAVLALVLLAGTGATVLSSGASAPGAHDSAAMFADERRARGAAEGVCAIAASAGRDGLLAHELVIHQDLARAELDAGADLAGGVWAVRSAHGTSRWCVSRDPGGAP